MVTLALNNMVYCVAKTNCKTCAKVLGFVSKSPRLKLTTRRRDAPTKNALEIHNAEFQLTSVLQFP